MTKNQSAFEVFMRQREEAARAYVRGDSRPVAALLTGGSVATFFAPPGGVVRGTSDVASRFAKDAVALGPAGETSFEVFAAAAGDEIAYWTGLQHAEAHLGGDVEPQRMSLRVTEVFRWDGGRWTLVHRHADPLASERDNG